MGEMKRIYEMVQDGTSLAFIDAYKKVIINNAATNNNVIGFTYDGVYYDLMKARAIISILKTAEKEYDMYIDRQAELDQASIES
jgi:hypothetical protein|tara:strand:- start:632 stop:883 length:252 start_codon:yes stop_codon:yes gene_type:complete